MDEVLAVLVLYRCSLPDSETFSSLNASLELANQRLTMLVYDNSPIGLYDKSDFRIGNVEIHYISNPQNPGVSKAYNVGADYAREKNKKWVLLLDQDTCFPVDSIAIYADYIKENTFLAAPILLSNNVCISPCYFKWGRGKALKYYRTGVHNLQQFSLLNSGLIIPLELFIMSGGYNEKIALDFSDHYFIDKVKKITFNYVLLNIECNHSLSAFEVDVNKAFNRFGYYLIGLKEYNDWKFTTVAFLRSIKLSLRYKNLCFFHKFVKEYIG